MLVLRPLQTTLNGCAMYTAGASLGFAELSREPCMAFYLPGTKAYLISISFSPPSTIELNWCNLPPGTDFSHTMALGGTMPEASIKSVGVEDFLSRWESSGAAERANYHLFLSELCDLLSVPRPNPTRPDDRDNSYVFERSVTFRHGTGQTSTGRIDLYKRGGFVLEAKQGSDRPTGNNTLYIKEEDSWWLTSRRGTAVRGTRGWDVAMLKAKGQAEQYARALPVEEGWPSGNATDWSGPTPTSLIRQSSAPGTPARWQHGSARGSGVRQH